jgi:hypothetical protein
MSTAKAVDTATIAAPPSKVYDFLSEAARATSFVPGLSKIDNIKPAAAQAGQTWNYEFDWFGLVVTGQSKCTRSDRPSLHQFETVTGNTSTWTYEINADGANTKLTLSVQYNVPDNAVSRFASRAVFEKMNQDRAHEIVSNIKTMLES